MFRHATQVFHRSMLLACCVDVSKAKENLYRCGDVIFHTLISCTLCFDTFRSFNRSLKWERSEREMSHCTNNKIWMCRPIYKGFIQLPWSLLVLFTCLSPIRIETMNSTCWHEVMWCPRDNSVLIVSDLHSNLIILFIYSYFIMGKLMSQCNVKGAIHTNNSLLLLDNITSLIHLNYKLKRLAECKETR